MKHWNKKASAQDLIYIAVVLLSFAIICVLGYMIAGEFNTHVQTTDAFNATNAPNARSSSTQLLGYYPTVMDNMYLFLAVALCIGALLMAAMVRVHPMFIALFFVTWIFIIFVCGMLSNTYQELASNPMISAEANNMIVMSTVMEYLPLFIGVFGIILMVVMYKSYQGAQDY
jgi:hypothetical protein